MELPLTLWVIYSLGEVARLLNSIVGNVVMVVLNFKKGPRELLDLWIKEFRKYPVELNIHLY
jgi:hypothetical protein